MGDTLKAASDRDARTVTSSFSQWFPDFRLRQCLAVHPTTRGHCISRRKMPPFVTELDGTDRRLTDAEASGDLALQAGRRPDRLDCLGRELRPPVPLACRSPPGAPSSTCRAYCPSESPRTDGPGSRTAGGPFEGLVGASCYFERSKVMLLRVMSFRESNN
jgi:hypothetical protein